MELFRSRGVLKAGCSGDMKPGHARFPDILVYLDIEVGISCTF